MPYVTAYSKTVKRRKTGRVETFATYYSTKSLTTMHAEIHRQHPDAETRLDPKRIITHFCLGLPLEHPILVGGTVVAVSELPR